MSAGNREAAGAARGLDSSDFEADALRQRQARSVVDGVGGATHVGLPGVRAGFAAAAGLLFAAEGTADFGAAGADIDVGDAAIRTSGRREHLGFAQVLREH